MALPFLGLIVLAKVMGPLRLAVLARLPQRYYWDLPEIPLVAYVGITLFGVTMQRCALHFVSITPVTVWKTLSITAGGVSGLCKGNAILWVIYGVSPLSTVVMVMGSFLLGLCRIAPQRSSMYMARVCQPWLLLAVDSHVMRLGQCSTCHTVPL